MVCMRQKMITLCPNSFEIAQKKPNFSAWVRKKLLENPAHDDTKPLIWYEYKCPLCKFVTVVETRSPQYCPNCITLEYPSGFHLRYCKELVE